MMGGGDTSTDEKMEYKDLESMAKEGAWYEHLQKFLAVQTLFPFAVPRIVCIGEESSGKSSTLERIAQVGDNAQRTRLVDRPTHPTRERGIGDRPTRTSLSLT
jgi:hypothetical protein